MNLSYEAATTSKKADQKPDAMQTSADNDLMDPFEDPALVTNAFLDILWQDERGNSALMLAAAENRILHVKGILTMAATRGTLWQVLNMRNDNGLSALELALRSGSDTCAMLITKFTKEYQLAKPHPRRMSFNRRSSNEASETDIMIEFDDATTPAMPFVAGDEIGFTEEELLADRNERKDKASGRPFLVESQQRRLSRDKLSNNLKRIPPVDFTKKMNRSGRPPVSKMIQRTVSGDSFSSLPSPSSSSNSPTENKLISVGDKLRSIFSSRKHSNPADTVASGHRPQEYKKIDEENRLLENEASIPSNTSSDQKIQQEEAFQSPWPACRPTRLPPLANLRRRTASENRTKSRQEA